MVGDELPFLPRLGLVSMCARVAIDFVIHRIYSPVTYGLHCPMDKRLIMLSVVDKVAWYTVHLPPHLSGHQYLLFD